MKEQKAQHADLPALPDALKKHAVDPCGEPSLTSPSLTSPYADLFDADTPDLAAVDADADADFDDPSASFTPTDLFDLDASLWPLQSSIHPSTPSANTLFPPAQPRSQAPYCALLDGHMPRGRTALHLLAESADSASTAALLARGADPGAADEFGITPAHVAARRGNVAALAVLLDAGVPVDARDANGWTALHHASWCGLGEVVAFLVGRGARVDEGVGGGGGVEGSG